MKARVVQHYDKGPLPTFKNLSKEIDVLVGVNAFIGQLIFESAFIGNQRKNVESSALPGNDNGRGLTNETPKRCRFMARITALTYSWWSLFVRLADPRQHTEAITSRPLLLHAPARLTRHSGQTRIVISHPHAEAAWVESARREIAAFFKMAANCARRRAYRPRHSRG